MQAGAPAPVPFSVGEELVYRASFAGVHAGTARMRVQSIELVRGRPAYHFVFTIDGGIPFYRVHDRYESWVDVETLSSLRYVQHISEGRYNRNTTYEIWPERAEYQKNVEPVQVSVANPLDEGSFIYMVRVSGVAPGATRTDARYFRPDRNPVVLTGVAFDTVTVAAGRFTTTVVHPAFKTSGLFAENTDARIWFSDDANRFPVLIKARFAHFTMTLSLASVSAVDSSLSVPNRSK
jgi:hypothetical protein